MSRPNFLALELDDVPRSVRDKRRELCAAVVTLDGRPAKISGALRRHPVVWVLDDPRISVAFTWESVERVIAAGGAFKS